MCMYVYSYMNGNEELDGSVCTSSWYRILFSWSFIDHRCVVISELALTKRPRNPLKLQINKLDLLCN